MILRTLVTILLHGDAIISSRVRAAAAAHAAAVKSGHAADVRLSNHLLNAYAKSGALARARRVFDEMPRRNLVSWSALISGHDQAGRPALALQLFARMDARPSEHAYASALRSCGALRAVGVGAQVHAGAVKTGLLAVPFVANSAISMYMRCGCSDEGYGVFRTLAEPNVESYNAVISGLVAAASPFLPARGMEVLRLMKLRSLRPDRFSYAGVLASCGAMENRRVGALLHCEALKVGLDAATFVGNVILDMYSKCGTMAEAAKVFRSVQDKDTVTWNTYIAAHSRRGEHGEALMVFRDMAMAGTAHRTRVSPDSFTYAGAMAACAELCSLRHGGQVYGRTIRSGEELDVAVGNATIDMYAKCGEMALAARVFDRLPSRNLLSWNTMICGLGRHGRAKEAMETFERMKEAGVAPDAATFTGVLAACSHAGLVSEGMAYLSCMRRAYGMSPRAEHVACMVDLLGRAGRLEEARGGHGYALASTELCADDPVALGSLLSASRVHGDAAAGETAARRLLALLPATSSPYVLLSHLYAREKRWDCVEEARRMLKNGVGKKEAGCSSVA